MEVRKYGSMIGTEVRPEAVPPNYDKSPKGL